MTWGDPVPLLDRLIAEILADFPPPRRDDIPGYIRETTKYLEPEPGQ